jgi:hypothetical protein
MDFRTKLDFSSNRQVKQHVETITNLSGATHFGVSFSLLTTGPNLTTTGLTQEYTTFASTFSGNSSTTVFNWGYPVMSLGSNTLSAITPSTSATTQIVGPIFTSDTTTVIDGNTVALSYSGVNYNIIPITVYDLGSGAYSGTVQTQYLNVYSAATLDFTGRTIWVDVSGITRTQDLIITDNPTIGYVWTCLDSEGRGYWNPASGATSGYWSAGTGTNAVVLNNSTGYAGGTLSLSEGFNTTAGGNFSHAEGLQTTTSGSASHAEGGSTTALGAQSHAEGAYTIAEGLSSHAEGNVTYAKGTHSHAEGSGTRASGSTSHSEGTNTTAIGTASHAEGYYTTATGNYSHAEGSGTTASGPRSHAEGWASIASGNNSHAEGGYSTSGSYPTTAVGNGSHAEGASTYAFGTASHSEGFETTAYGNNSHAEGKNTTALGADSHAGGAFTIASGNTSFVHGSGSTAGGVNTIVLGANITGTTDNTTYVDSLNIKTVGVGPGTTDIGIDANGFVVNQASDLRLKENITPLTNALDKVKNLRGVTYQWKDKSAGGESFKIGFIAQEVYAVEPLLTFVNDKTKEQYMGVHYKDVTALLVEAVKELASGITNSNNAYLETQTILAEDNNIDLNFNGTPETAFEGGIRVLHARGVDLSSEFLTDANGDWVTNNDLKPKSLTIPQYTPTSSNDTNGNVGNITRDENYIYVKCNDGWKRSGLESF